MRIHEITDEYASILENDGATTSGDIASLAIPMMKDGKAVVMRRVPEKTSKKKGKR